MATPAASPPVNLSFTCTNEEVVIALYKWTSGSPLPSNVIEENPYRLNPENLPDGHWFLICSRENIDMEHGLWKIKEEACEVFSNSDIIGWRTTLEYKGQVQVPYESKTNWLMHVFSTTLKRLSDDNEKKEMSSLCRVFLVPSHEMQQRVSSTGIDTEIRNQLAQPPVLDANSCTRIGSSSNPVVNKPDETEVLAVAERLPVREHQGENLVKLDFFSRPDLFSGGNFIELKDLDNPASSSSSENSSAMSISSDECFDSMAFLQDLEDQNVEQNDAGRRLNVSAPNKSDEVVIVSATLGSVVRVEGSNSTRNEFCKTAGSVPVSASGSKDRNNKVAKHAKGNQRGEVPLSASSSSSSSSSSDSHTAAAGGRKRAAFGGMKKLGRKYLCFISC